MSTLRQSSTQAYLDLGQVSLQRNYLLQQQQHCMHADISTRQMVIYAPSSQKHFSIRRCVSCGMMYTPGIPGDEELHRRSCKPKQPVLKLQVQCLLAYLMVLVLAPARLACRPLIPKQACQHVALRLTRTCCLVGSFACYKRYSPALSKQ